MKKYIVISKARIDEDTTVITYKVLKDGPEVVRLHYSMPRYCTIDTNPMLFEELDSLPVREQ